jgi:hypothetical protein
MVSEMEEARKRVLGITAAGGLGRRTPESGVYPTARQTHAFHHKGQIVATLRILGYPAPDADLQQV